MFYLWGNGWWAAVAMCVFLTRLQLQAASVHVAWDPNTEPDLAGYRIYYGVSSRDYTHQVDVGNVTTATVSNLQYGVTYFFSATAYNTSGLESDFSNEASTQLVPPQGNNPPTLDAISNMVVAANSGPVIINLTGIGSGSTNEVQTITVTASSSDPSIVPEPSVSYQSPEATGTLSFTPVSTAQGVAEITVIVNDGQSSNSTLFRTFDVTVLQPPLMTVTRSAANNLIISWPAGDYVLQSCTDLPPAGTWSDVSIAPTPNGTNQQVSIPATQSRQFFRLVHATSAESAAFLRFVTR